MYRRNRVWIYNTMTNEIKSWLFRKRKESSNFIKRKTTNKIRDEKGDSASNTTKI